MLIKKYETEFGGKKLCAEISDIANQTNGSILVRYGDTTVFATAVMSKNKREGLDYFPLTVDYEEKFYAAGMILGSRFIRREGRPSEDAILTSRLVDRTIRPLFDKRIRNEIQVVVLALSIDNENDPDIPAIIAASLALGISDIPWKGPSSAVRIGYSENFIVNPYYKERENSLLDIVICGKNGKINMIEAGAREVSEDIAGQAIKKALLEIEKIQHFQEKIISEAGKEKIKIEIKEPSSDMQEFFNKNILQDIKSALFSGVKKELSEIKSHWIEIAKEKFGENNNGFLFDDIYEKNIDEIVHKEILENDKRPDSRKLDEIRPLYAEVGILPVLHGSGIFFRGGTHILSALTLGGPKDIQLIAGMETQTTKHFMHHYNFPPFSTGETGRMGGTGRREIGHGALAEKALSAVIPDRDKFPYTIRIVSESMASNGSTSMGSVCASTLALMNAGVPIKNPVAGIAIGLMMDKQNYKILTDIQGPEDHYGDMDFKCAGTKNGITAIQMDVKIEGVNIEILEKTLIEAKKARSRILDAMLKIISEPAKELSPNAPRIIKMQINQDKIRDVIGPGGRIINGIIEKTGADIDIEQDGTVFITGKNHKDLQEAKKIIENITHEFEVNEIVSGPVTRLFDFGAMVEIGQGQEGLIHISELSCSRVNKVTDIVKIGDIVKVKIISIDEKGRINLSLKQMSLDKK